MRASFGGDEFSFDGIARDYDKQFISVISRLGEGAVRRRPNAESSFGYCQLSLDSFGSYRLIAGREYLDQIEV
jgi:hypothetical protein